MYQYDYWYYYNNTQGNCVPEGKFFDLKTNTLTQCNQINYNLNILVQILILLLIQQQRNVFIVIISVIKMVNVL